MDADLVQVAIKNQVRTLTMNQPKRLNGWTAEMMAALKDALRAADADADTRVIVITGSDPYYSAGVNLGGTLKLAHPRTLHAQIVAHNQALFDAFINVAKPILAAVNGPAIGACVTTATLCDAILASDRATFSTPFARLGVPPEGCSSVLFARLIGEVNATRMLGVEGWAPTGAEAAQIGLAERVVPHERLRDEAQQVAEAWVAAGRTRGYRGGATADELRRVNAQESIAVATAFLSPPFLRGQYAFLSSRGKRGPALMFWLLWRTHPLWSRLR
jgi:enoyl-CoA hydratase/carnithine racemase